MKRKAVLEIDVRPGNENRCGECFGRTGGYCHAFPVRGWRSRRLRVDRDGYLVRCHPCRVAEKEAAKK